MMPKMTKKKLIITDIILISALIWLIFSLNTPYLNQFDSYIYSLVTTNINPTLTTFFKIITFFGSTIFIVSATIIIFLTMFKSKRGVQYLILIATAMLLSSVLKIIIHRPRPDVLKLVIETTYSFPSGHTMAISSLMGFIFYLLEIEKGKGKKLSKIIGQLLCFIITLLVIISRIYLGAHYASDTIGAVIIATLVLINLTFWFQNWHLPSSND